MRPQPPRDWDDDRLEAAFAARSAATPPTPSDLVDEALARIQRGERRAIAWPRVAFTGAVAALVVVLAGSTLLRTDEPLPGASKPPGATDGAPTAEAADVVLEALGDPITVSEALAIRDSEIDQQEILVKGFLSPPPSVQCMALTLHPHPLMPPICSAWQWLMESPEQFVPTGSSVVSGGPAGPVLVPSFALVASAYGPLIRNVESPVPIVLMGHFNDRRASFCGDKQEQCLDTFLVDRLVEVNGVAHPVRTNNLGAHIPEDPESDVDALVATAAPTAGIVSRQLVTAAQALDLEPVLKQDQIVPYIDRSKLVWLVTTVDLSDVPYARTFMLLDGSSWFAEITRSGAVMHERSAPAPTRGAVLGPTAEPDGFAGAPFSVAGIRVEGVSEITRKLRAEDSTILREEHAVRGWYIAPRPGVICDPTLPPVHAPTPPCDEARHWLLTDPQLYGVEEGQLRRDPVGVATILNPLLPVDVPLDVGETWRGDVPVPQPVVVLGHFNDSRVNGYRSDAYFVIDALAWSRTDRALDRVTRMTPAATEDPSTVAARIDAISSEEPLATWLTAMDAADFAIVESSNAAGEAREFTSGPPVWIVQRLVLREDELEPEFAIETGYTADHGTRVWWRPTLDWYLDLATTIDFPDLDEYTDVLKVFDYSDVVVSIGSAEGRSGLSWRKAGPATGDYEVARGRTDREVVVRWRGRECAGSQRLNVADLGNGGIRLEPREVGPTCTSGDVWRQVVIEFDHPVDVDRFRTGDPCCG
jgi:hypothetical protein